MGLAASQARLLFITSRQNDVSAKMQRISNENMVLSRDADIVSDNYNRMLTATKMQLKGGESSSLSYDTLMGNNAVVNGTLGDTLITETSSGKVVLSKSYADRLGLTSSCDQENAKSVLSKAGINNSDDLKTKLSPLIEVTKVESETDDTSIDADVKSRADSFKDSYGDYPTTKTTTMSTLLLAAKYQKDTFKAWDTTTTSADFGNFKKSISGMSLYDLAHGNTDYIIKLADDGERRGVPFDEARNNFKTIGNDFVELIKKALNIESDDFDNTMKSYVANLANQINFSDENCSKDKSGLKSAVTQAENALVTNFTTDTRGTDRDGFTLNVSELIRRLIQKACSLYSNVSEPFNKVKEGHTNINALDSTVVMSYNSKGYSISDYQNRLKAQFPDDTEYNTALKYLKGTSSDKNKSNGSSKVDFYATLYQNLIDKGWIIDGDTSSSKLSDKLTNGTYSIGGSVISNSNLFEEVADEETQKKAEAYWNVEMGKINRKEKKLDNDLSKLQTEYSSLTTDYESVKGIINANVSRSFTYCQNG